MLVHGGTAGLAAEQGDGGGEGGAEGSRATEAGAGRLSRDLWVLRLDFEESDRADDQQQHCHGRHRAPNFSWKRLVPEGEG